MSNLTTVVALLSLGAIPAHVSEPSARIASGLAGTTVATASATTTAGAIASPLVTAAGATAIGTTLGAIPGNVTPSTAFVAFLTATTTASAHTSASSWFLVALPAEMTGVTATIAGFLRLGRSTLPRQMTLLTTVVASWVALGRALGCTMRGIATVVTTTASHTWTGKAHVCKRWIRVYKRCEVEKSN